MMVGEEVKKRRVEDQRRRIGKKIGGEERRGRKWLLSNYEKKRKI
jgi:hypothetical protein